MKLTGLENWIISKEIVKEVWVKPAFLLAELVDRYSKLVRKWELEDDFFSYTSNELQKNTGLSYSKQKRCLEILEKKWYIEIVVKWIPAQKYYKLNNKTFLSYKKTKNEQRYNLF